VTCAMWMRRHAYPAWLLLSTTLTLPRTDRWPRFPRRYPEIHLIILTAKARTVPIDPTKLVKISPTIAVADVGSANLAQQTADAISSCG